MLQAESIPDARSYSAVIFDLDGTLIDTCADLAASVNMVLARFGYPVHPAEEYRTFIGNGARMLVSRALGSYGDDPALVEQCLADFRREYAAHWADTTKPFEGVVLLLDMLTDKNIPFAVLTNKPHEAAVACVEMFFPRHSFAMVQGEEDGIPPKPDPLGAKKIVAALGVDPADVLYIGDMDVDMSLARNAGFTAGAALWGYQSKERLEGAGAQLFFDRPGDVVLLL